MLDSRDTQISIDRLFIWVCFFQEGLGFDVRFICGQIVWNHIVSELFHIISIS